jgi:hypothetical protein
MMAYVKSRLRWLSDEAHSHGWKLLARHHAAEVTYVLVDEHGEMDFKTLDEVEQQMHNLCLVRKLAPLREI